MIWKFPSRFPPVYMEEVNPETMREVEQDQLKSTYQSDYTGIPQGKSSEKKITKFVLLAFKLVSVNSLSWWGGGCSGILVTGRKV